MAPHNPFDDPDIENNYEAWYGTVGRRADQQEKDLLIGIAIQFS
jgi:hypothetical protein